MQRDRVAIDIGGTFTDLAAVDLAAGGLVLAKTPTTPDRLHDGVMAALERSGLAPASVGALVHGTTLVINAITERRGAPTALVTTEGFRDVLEIGRANRPDLYNLSYAKPAPFVPRRLRFEVAERMSYRGEVITPLEEGGLRAIARTILESGIGSVAICFLHSWANPVHERRAAELLAELLPDAGIVASYEVSGQWREYERTSTAVLSAYVKPVVARYLAMLRDRIRDVRGRRIATIFQSPVASFNPVFRVGDVFVRALLLHGAASRREARRRAAEALRGVVLSPALLSRYPHQLSGGQAQRVAIALALALQSEVLLADEPTSALDVTVQAEILELLRKLRDQRGMSMMFISHDLAVVSELCDRIAVMRAGRIVEEGTAREVLGSPREDYTKDLVAAVPKVGRAERTR